ncbi:MAG: Ig-like domain-containing protein [Candidatus Omnitrophica bacterium]|nr:Ig-like domain-containing protein [Candidatus Omnitrophota bacterium]
MKASFRRYGTLAAGIGIWILLTQAAWPAEQWAVNATASSQRASTYWSAEQATGEPDVTSCRSSTKAWSPYGTGSDAEWLLLTYETPYNATSISIHETYSAPFVSSIDYIEPNGTEHTVWSENDTTACNGYLTVNHSATGYLVKKVRINTAVDGREQIDAVKLSGTPSSDTTAPVVNVTFPSSGANVSGTINLTADATDNVRVIGVQFKVDHSPVGDEDMTAPYGISFDSTAFSNGNYPLTAVARDDAGNTATSEPVNITINGTPPLSYGDTVSAAIGYEGDIDEYPFEGVSNETVHIPFKKMSGTLYMRVELYDPDETMIAYAWSSSAKTMKETLSATGTHTIKIFDKYGDRTGDYEFTLQRIQNPAGVQPLEYGVTAGGNLTRYTQIHAYNLTLEAGDTITVSSAEISTFNGTFSPYLELYDYSGEKIGFSSTEIITSVDETGEYTLFVSELYSKGTGEYQVCAQRVNDPGNAVPLSNGQSLNATIGYYAELDIYRISGGINDELSIDITELNTTSGSFGAYCRLYAPNGTSLKYGSSISAYVLPVTGDYCLLVYDLLYDGAGTYNVECTIESEIAGVGIEPQSFNPRVNETVAIGYTLDEAANVTLDIYDLDNTLIRQLLNGTSRQTGPHNETWDGRNDSGGIVADGGYTFTIEAQPQGGGATGIYNPSLLAQPQVSNQRAQESVNPYAAELYNISYTLSGPCRLLLRGANEEAGNYGVADIVDNARLGGNHTEYWDGYGPYDKIIPDHVLFGWWVYQLPENTIVVSCPPVSLLTGLEVVPYLFSPGHGEVTQIHYNLSADVTLSMKVYEITTFDKTLVKTLLDGVNKTAGDYMLEYNGTADSGGILLPDDYLLELELERDNETDVIRKGYLGIR